MARKTNAIRQLDGAGMSYEVREYQLEEEAFSAQAVAACIGLPAAQVFKTLLVRGERTGPCFAVLPGDVDLDLKALARAAGDRRVMLVPVKEVESLTGHRRGAVTALGARKAFPVYLDLGASGHRVISVSGGARGVQVLLSPDDYVSLTRATLVALTRR